MADRAICSVDGCGKAAHGRTYCSSHLNRYRRYGDPVAGAAHRERQDGACAVADCERPAQRRGLCGKHYQRLWKHGDASVSLNPIGERPAFCSVSGCNDRHHAHGYCANHAYRLRSHGDALAGGDHRASPGEARRWIEEHANFDGEGCLKYPHGKTAYAAVDVNGVMLGAHRYMCTIAHGQPPLGKDVAAHSCGKAQDGCISPRHLRWATYAENEADKVVHGTRLVGEQVHSAKLTEADVREIRQLRGTASQWDIARKFGVSQSAVSSIYRRQAWAWLD